MIINFNPKVNLDDVSDIRLFDLIFISITDVSCFFFLTTYILYYIFDILPSMIIFHISAISFILIILSFSMCVITDNVFVLYSKVNDKNKFHNPNGPALIKLNHGILKIYYFLYGVDVTTRIDILKENGLTAKEALDALIL